MKRWSLVAGAALLVGAAPSPDAIVYSLAPVMRDDGLSALAVELRFRGDADGETRLLLPDEWAGTDKLWQAVTALEVVGGEVVEDGDAARRIRHAPSSEIVVRYRLVSRDATDPGAAYAKARPIVRPGWFFFHGEGLFATVEGRGEAPARFGWQGWPAGWRMASDLDHLASRPGTVPDVLESAAIGATDLQLVERQVDGAPFRLAMRGSWSFTAEALADRVAAIMVAQNRYWGDRGRAFFVPVAPLATEGTGRSTHGTGRRDGFAIASTVNFGLDEATQFLAHEYMHSWIGGEIGGPLPEDEARGYWLTEGFTDFLAAKTLVRSGVWTLEDYVRHKNEVLMRLASSPARRLGNSEIAKRFWSDGSAQQLAYDRGHSFALWADQQLRASGGIDAAMRRQRRLARDHSRAGRRVPAAALFPIAVRRSGGELSTAALAAHVERGEPVVLPERIACLVVETVERHTFDRGFDIDATVAADMVVSGVDPLGTAHAAGLRDGMKLIRREAGEIGNADVDIAYRVADGGGERLIRYRPAARRALRVQQLRVPPLAPAERRDCAAAL